MKGSKKCLGMKSLSTFCLRFLCLLLVCCSLFLSSIFSPSASAIDGFRVVPTKIRYHWSAPDRASGWDEKSFTQSNQYSWSGTVDYDQTFDYLMFGGFPAVTIDNGSYYTVTFNVGLSDLGTGYFTGIDRPFVQAPGWQEVQTNIMGTDVLYSNVELISNSSNELIYTVTLVGRAYHSTATTTAIAWNGRWLFNAYTKTLNWAVTQPNITFSANLENAIKNAVNSISNDTSAIRDLLNKGIKVDMDDTGIVTEQKNTTSAVLNLNQAVKDQAKQQHSDSQAQLKATEDQTKQQQEQYDQEKAEEAERENNAKDEGNGLLGIFNITLLNPFAGIWEIFNAGGCTSIPTIANWLGSDNTTYCSWWPQSIRATLTPVFSLAAMMLLFGFVARWLGGSEGFSVKLTEGFHGF